MITIYEEGVSFGIGACATIYRNILTGKFCYVLFEIAFFEADPNDYPVLESDPDGTFDTAIDAIHDAEQKALERGIVFYDPERFNLRGEQ